MEKLSNECDHSDLARAAQYKRLQMGELNQKFISSQTRRVEVCDPVNRIFWFHPWPLDGHFVSLHALPSACSNISSNGVRLY